MEEKAAAKDLNNATAELLPGLLVPQTRRILHLMYAQSFFLVVTYVLGIWLATIMAAQVAVTQPEVIVHVALASTFASLTIALAFLALLQHQRGIAALNLALFLVMVLAGVTGFLLLGNTSSSSQVTITNLTMMSGVGVAMPVTGYSMAKEARIVRSGGAGGGEPSPAVGISLVALLALSMTAMAGVSTRAVSLASSLAGVYDTAVAVHFGLAAITMSLVLGVLVLSIFEGTASGARSPQLARQRALFAVFGLASVSFAGGAGVIAAGLVPGSSGGTSYLVMMGEAAAFVYAFLILVITAPLIRRPNSSMGTGDVARAAPASSGRTGPPPKAAGSAP